MAGRELLFDIETNGLMDTPWDRRKDPVDRMHCWVAIDLETDEVFKGRPGEEQRLLELLDESRLLAGHNITNYDLPVLKLLYGWTPKPEVDLLDTQRAGEMAFSKDRIFRINRWAEKKFGPPPKGVFQWGHSLAIWAWRAGSHKDDFGKSTDWKVFSEEMLDYCEQDVIGNAAVFRFLIEKSNYSKESMILDSNVAAILFRQRLRGVRLDEEKARALGAKLTSRRDEIADELRSIFPEWWVANGTVTPKRSMTKTKGEVAPKHIKEGCTYTKTKLQELNPASRHHIARCLKVMHGWTPKEFNKDGSAKVDRAILKALPWKEAHLFAEYEELHKKATMVSEGEKSWLQLAVNGKLHGKVNTSGAKTGRMTHNDPNCAQVPSVGKPYGQECRECFVPTVPGWVLVGCDASGLELRMLAHYMAKWDKGAFVKDVLEGDIHSTFREGFGLFYRSNSKTCTYATLYGAGPPKIGETVHHDWAQAFEAGETDRPPPPLTEKVKATLGKKARTRLESKIPAFAKLTKRVQGRKKKPGYVVLPDGRLVYIESEHAALNMLLQGAGAIVMKKALIILDRSLQLEGLKPGSDYEFLLNSHDEWQIECPLSLSDFVGRMAVAAIELAGEAFNMKCPLTGEYKVGESWADTH